MQGGYSSECINVVMIRQVKILEAAAMKDYYVAEKLWFTVA
jgi:hypothetical protein